MGNFISPLRRALRANDSRRVERILKEAGEGSPEVVDEDYTGDCLYDCGSNTQSPLHTAVIHRQHTNVELMLKYGAEADGVDKFGTTALLKASHRNDLEMVKLLVQYGANVKAEDNNGQTVLHEAASSYTSSQQGDVGVLKYFIEEHAMAGEINAQDADLNTPLHSAAKFGVTCAARYLAQQGASLEMRNTFKRTPLEVAKKHEKWRVVQFLEKAVPVTGEIQVSETQESQLGTE